MNPNFAVEIAYTHGYFAYLVSMNTSRWLTEQKIQYRVTSLTRAGEAVPISALKVHAVRAAELAGILNKCGRIAKVIETKEVAV